MVELYVTKEEHYTVEANLLTAENAEAVAVWCGGIAVIEHDALDHGVTYAAINVPTSDGPKRAQEGDWIVRQPTGFFEPMKYERFRMLFDPLSDKPHD